MESVATPITMLSDFRINVLKFKLKGANSINSMFCLKLYNEMPCVFVENPNRETSDVILGLDVHEWILNRFKESGEKGSSIYDHTFLFF